jgi:hypothetical protein
MATRKCKEAEKKKGEKEAKAIRFECKSCGSSARKERHLCKPKKATTS